MSLFLEEVKQQSRAIQETLDYAQSSVLQSDRPFLITGMGSSLCASEILASYLTEGNISAKSVDNSELLYFYPESYFKNHQVIAISQSGESFEVKKLCKLDKDITGITNSPNSYLSNHSNPVFFTKAGEEKAIASSKSFTTTVALLLKLGAEILSDRTMSEDLQRIKPVITDLLKGSKLIQQKIGSFLDVHKPIILLGRGPSVSVARQGALTLKETARMFAEGMSAPAFRHGPYELIAEELQSIFFNPKGRLYKQNQAYVLELAENGAKVLYISDHSLEHPNVLSITVDSINEYCSTIIHSLIIQLAAIELSYQKGLVAGEAKFLNKVTSKQ